MKKIIFICIVFLGGTTFFSSLAFSQQTIETHPPHPGPAGREPDYEKLKTDLSLSDEQVASWKTVEEKYKAKFKELQSNSTLSDEDKRIEMKQLLASKEEDLKKVLSDDQYTKLATNRPQRKDKK